MTPLILIAAALCVAFAWSAVLVGVGTAKGRLAGEWVLWTFDPTPAEPAPAPAQEDEDEDAAVGFAIPEQRRLAVKWRTLGFTLSAAAALLAAGCALIVAGALTTYPRNYEHKVWGTLSDTYRVHAAVPGQGFEPGVPFPALVDGKTVECSVTPPSAVVCDGQVVEPVK